MINKISFKNYKSFKDRQELDLLPMTVFIGKNSAGKSAVMKLTTLIEDSLKGKTDAPLKWTGYENSVELGAEFEDLIYGRSRTGKLELEMSDGARKLEVIIGSEKEAPKVFSWKYNEVEKLGFDNLFKGFTLETEDKSLYIDPLFLNTDYIGPFRMTPLREFSELNLNATVQKIGYTGQDAYTVLLQDGLTTSHPLLNKVSEWYQANFEDWGVQINKDFAPFYQVEIIREHGVMRINLKDVGQGMSQALPLVVKAFMENDTPELIPIEQPELHLHPAAHGSLGELFVQSLENKLKSYLIETHSQNFVLRLRRLIAEKKYTWFTKDSLALYFIDFDEKKNTSTLRRININEKGEVDYWPGTIFSETLDETIALRDAQS